MHPVDESEVIISYVSPGACKSDIFRPEGGHEPSILVTTLMGLISRSTEVGSRSLVHAVEPKLDKDAHGRFLWDCQIHPNGENIEGEKGQRAGRRFLGELWDLLERIEPGVTRS